VVLHQLNVARLELERRSGHEIELNKAREESAQHAQHSMSLAEQLRSATLGPGAGPGAGADEWTEERLMQVGAYRDLSARWSALGLAFASLQTEGEARAELLEQKAAHVSYYR
jgi:hypothetical protein